MRTLSIKVRITLWYTALMSLMAALVLVVMLAVSSTVVSRAAMDQLSQAVRGNLGYIGMKNNKLQLEDGFRFYQNGVYILIYSDTQALLAGQIPTAFTSAAEPFQNGLTRPVDTDQGRYYVMDLWVPIGWENGVWVRGLLAAPEEHRTAQNLLYVAMVTMPLFILLAGLGGYWIAKRAFRPLDHLTATAAAINEAKDLTARVAVPEGKNEFARLAGTFNQMFERLERAFEAEKQFTADASHELRTPVSVILGACDYAQKFDDTPEERQETISMIQRQAQKMSRLIAQLLSMTRMEQGTEQAQLGQTDLTALVRTVCQERDYGRDLHLELQEGVTAQIDTPLMTRLMENLIENAVKYGREGSHVWVSLRKTEEAILLSVRDNGIGIPQDQQEKIWQRFYQVDPARTGGGGAGLGLAMVQQIAQIHGGGMSVESAPGLGSTFTLHLPVSV